MCTVNRLFKHIIPNDGNDGNVTCCRTLRMPICYKAAAIGQSLINIYIFKLLLIPIWEKSPKFQGNGLFLFGVLRHFGLQVKNVGHSTGYFALERGTRQGQRGQPSVGINVL